MRFVHCNSRPWLLGLLLLTLVGATVLVVTIKGPGLAVNRYNSQQATTVPKSPPVLVEELRYEGCGHRVEEKRELSAELRLLAPKEIAQIYNASTYQTSDERLRLFNDRPGLCPACKEHIFVSLDGDEVAVFYGLPGGPQQLKERIQIRTEGLPLQAVLDLRRGIPVTSEKEFLHVLEGLMN